MYLVRKQRKILGFLLVFGPATFLVFIATRGCSHHFKNLDVLATLPEYEFIDAYGKQRTSKEFQDEVVLITTLQKSCPYECAVSFWHINQILYQHIRKNSHKQLKKVRIISFVTDGKGNPVSNIRDLQETLSSQVEGYQPDLWILAQGDAKKMYDLSRNGQNLLQEGKPYYGGQAFQELILLVDKQNQLRMVLKGNQEGLVRRMKESLALLLKQYDKERAAR
jgi:cytochrome oxidase Cu insertion factor (SCO1/SenC/PrrC family)